MSLREKTCRCGFVAKKAKGFASHTRHCQMYKDALNQRRLGPARLLNNAARTTEQSSQAVQPSTEITQHIVQEPPGPSHQFGEQNLFLPSSPTNSVADIPMVCFFIPCSLKLIHSWFRMSPKSIIMLLGEPSAQSTHVACLRAIRTSFHLYLLKFFSQKYMKTIHRSHQIYQTQWKLISHHWNPIKYQFTIPKKTCMVYFIHFSINFHHSYPMAHWNTSATRPTLT